MSENHAFYSLSAVTTAEAWIIIVQLTIMLLLLSGCLNNLGEVYVSILVTFCCHEGITTLALSLSAIENHAPPVVMML